MVGQDNDRFDGERVPVSRVPKRRTQLVDMVGQEPQPAVRQVRREEIAAARDDAAAIARHRRILRPMGFAPLNPSYSHSCAERAARRILSFLVRS